MKAIPASLHGGQDHGTKKYKRFTRMSHAWPGELQPQAKIGPIIIPLRPWGCLCKGKRWKAWQILFKIGWHYRGSQTNILVFQYIYCGLTIWAWDIQNEETLRSLRIGKSYTLETLCNWHDQGLTGYLKAKLNLKFSTKFVHELFFQTFNFVLLFTYTAFVFPQPPALLECIIGWRQP